MVTDRRKRLLPEDRSLAHAIQAQHGRPYLLAFRLLTGVALTVVAIFATLDWAAAVSRDTQPEIALRALGDDSFARAQLASRMQLRPEKSDDPAYARRLARSALVRDPTHSQAVRAIGFLSLQTGDVAGAARAIEFTHQMTRRDVAAELWLIEYNVQLGKVREALGHFDAAASTSIEIQQTLFPILSGSLDDPRLVQPMADMLRRKPWWLLSLLRMMADGPSTGISAAANAAHASNVLSLFKILARRSIVFQQETIDRLVARLPNGRPEIIAAAKALPVG